MGRAGERCAEWEPTSASSAGEARGLMVRVELKRTMRYCVKAFGGLGGRCSVGRCVLAFVAFCLLCGFCFFAAFAFHILSSPVTLSSITCNPA